MRRFIAVAVAVVALFGAIAPASAQVPAPKVTITGLLDFATSISKNWSALDVTDGGKDDLWYSRERGVFNIIAEVGRTKAVWAIELDFSNGQGAAAPGNSAGFDLDTDVAAVVETKWLYLETPIMGPGSIMPFIPVSTIMRAGGQPARGHEYKNGIIWAGDFPGVTLESTWAPNLKSTVTYAQIGEGLNVQLAPDRATTNEDFAILASVEFEVFKGLTVKPTYAYSSHNCGNTGTGNLGTEAKNGFNPNACVSGVNNNDLDTRRHTLGGDVRWTAGPFTVQPTFLYQFGSQEIGTANGDSASIQTWIVDLTAGFRTGPLNIEGRFFWTPGMSADDTVVGGDTVKYYQPINSGFGYWGGGGFTEIQSSGIEYNNSLLTGAPGLSLRTSPSYDKYGRIMGALSAEYSLTPALSVRTFGNISWTDKSVDTDAVLLASGLAGGDGDGDERFLGWEVGLGMTYRFAPNVSFDLVGAYMHTGDAMNHARAVGGDVKDADPVYKGVARVRFTF